MEMNGAASTVVAVAAMDVQTEQDVTDLSPFELATSQTAVVAAGAPTAMFAEPFHAAVSATEAAPMQQQKQRKGLAALLTCSCFGGSSAADTASTLAPSSGRSSVQHDVMPTLILAHSSDSPRKVALAVKHCGSPRKQYQLTGVPSLRRASSTAYSDAEWHDAASHFSGSTDQDHGALEEVTLMVRELGAFKAPWIPDPPLAFGTPGTQYVPVPAVTGFAAYWLRDDERTTPFPQPIDVMLKANMVVQRTHASIPGIWIQETPTELSIIATPAFLPPFLGINGYAELYDKSNKIEHSWMPRRDLKMGRAYGKLYMTADGMLIARVWQKPAFSDRVDIIMEEYMRLEQNGEVIVDRMTCMHVDSGKRATQYQVGFRRDAP